MYMILKVLQENNFFEIFIMRKKALKSNIEHSLWIDIALRCDIKAIGKLIFLRMLNFESRKKGQEGG